MFNHDLLAEVQFWRDFLGRSTSAISLPFGPAGQQTVISTLMSSSKVRWPGIPEEHAKPFKNVDHLDDQLTWAEADGLPGEDDDEHEQDEHEQDETQGAWDGPDGEQLTA